MISHVDSGVDFEDFLPLHFYEVDFKHLITIIIIIINPSLQATFDAIYGRIHH